MHAPLARNEVIKMSSLCASSLTAKTEHVKYHLQIEKSRKQVTGNSNGLAFLLYVTQNR